MPVPAHQKLVFCVLAALAGAWPFHGAAQVRRTAFLTGSDIQGFIYIEPFEIREEFVLRLRAFADGPEAETGAAAQLDAARQAELLDSFRSRLTDACHVRADGKPLAFELDQIQFIAIDPEAGPRPDDRELIPATEAIIAAVFSSARTGFPDKLEIEWSLFPTRAEIPADVPVQLEAMSGRSIYSEDLTFSPQNTVQSWMLPEVEEEPRLLEIAEIPRSNRTPQAILTAIFLVAALGLAALGFSKRAQSRTSLRIASAVSFVLAGGMFYQVYRANAAGRLSSEDACNLAEVLLKNVYHAFAFRDESTIFDTLAASVDGPLLEELYLDIRRGLELEDTGGPRVKVLRVALTECAAQPAGDGGGIRAQVAWASMGNVSHWGHIHARRNKYRGQLLIEPVDGVWKITEVKILEEERI